MQYPFDDNDMYFDNNKDRYILNEQCLQNELGINLSQEGQSIGDSNPSVFAKRVLDRISRIVYNYIYEGVIDVELHKQLLKKTPSIREKLRDMMLYQVEYIYNASLSTMSNGIINGNIQDISLLRDKRKVADEVDQICNQTVREWGVALRYSGKFNYCNILGGYNVCK